MPITLVCAYNSCKGNGKHICEKCKCVGYCCKSCMIKDKKFHSTLCNKKLKTKTKSKTKNKSK